MPRQPTCSDALAPSLAWLIHVDSVSRADFSATSSLTFTRRSTVHFVLAVICVQPSTSTKPTATATRQSSSCPPTRCWPPCSNSSRCLVSCSKSTLTICPASRDCQALIKAMPERSGLLALNLSSLSSHCRRRVRVFTASLTPDAFSQIFQLARRARVNRSSPSWRRRSCATTTKWLMSRRSTMLSVSLSSI